MMPRAGIWGVEKSALMFLWGIMNFLGDGTGNGKLTDKLLPKMIF
jgi:hypothetical protein